MILTPAAGALFAAAAEAIFDPATPLKCELPAWIATDYEHVGTLFARNALFGTQRLGLGAPVYFGFVARHRHLGYYAVAIRGTELPKEWIEDAEAAFVLHPLGGLVHLGFFSLYGSMTLSLVGIEPLHNVAAAPALLELMEKEPGPVTFIGHSLGGPLATYFALDVSAAAPPWNVSAQLYASPKPGDALFAHAFDAKVGHDNYIVHNYIRDRVPHLPPDLFFGLGFHSLLNINLITPATAKAQIADDVRCNHIASSYAAMLGATVPSGSPCIEVTTP